MKSLLLLAALFVAFPAFAETPDNGAAPSIAFVFTPSLTSVRSSSDLPQEQGMSSSRKSGLGVGFLMDSPMTPNLSLGAGALYIKRKFQIGTGTIQTERTVPTIFVPVEVKIWLMNMLSVGGGVFGAFKTGDVTDTLIMGGSSLQSTTANDHKSFEYGLTVSANLLMPIAERTGLIVGARYLRGLSDGSSSAFYDEQIDDLALTAGVSLSL